MFESEFPSLEKFLVFAKIIFTLEKFLKQIFNLQANILILGKSKKIFFWSLGIYYRPVAQRVFNLGKFLKRIYRFGIFKANFKSCLAFLEENF